MVWADRDHAVVVGEEVVVVGDRVASWQLDRQGHGNAHGLVECGADVLTIGRAWSSDPEDEVGDQSERDRDDEGDADRSGSRPYVDHLHGRRMTAGGGWQLGAREVHARCP